MYCITFAFNLDMPNKLNTMPTYNFQPISLLDPGCRYKFSYLMTNSENPDQLASTEAK